MINDIETTDIKASFTVSRLLWSMLNTAFAGDDDEDALSFYDKELLDAEKYKMKYESAQQTIAELKRENSIIRRRKNSAQARSEREEKLKRRFLSLENLVKRYQTQMYPTITEI